MIGQHDICLPIEHVVATLTKRFAIANQILDERALRLFLGTCAELLGHGGIAFVSRLSGVSAATVSRSVNETPERLLAVPADRVRDAGGGRKPARGDATRVARGPGQAY
jgi:hypothetical protein